MLLASLGVCWHFSAQAVTNNTGGAEDSSSRGRSATQLTAGWNLLRYEGITMETSLYYFSQSLCAVTNNITFSLAIKQGFPKRFAILVGRLSHLPSVPSWAPAASGWTGCRIKPVTSPQAARNGPIWRIHNKWSSAGTSYWEKKSILSPRCSDKWGEGHCCLFRQTSHTPYKHVSENKT